MVVDEQALICALSNDHIQSVGLDVFEKKPIDSDNLLLTIDNVVITSYSLCHIDTCYQTIWIGKIH